MRVLPKMKEWRVVAIYDSGYFKDKSRRWILLQSKMKPHKGLLVQNIYVGTAVSVHIIGAIPDASGYVERTVSAVCVCERCCRGDNAIKKLKQIAVTAKRHGIQVVSTRYAFRVDRELFFMEARFSEEKDENGAWCIR